MAPTIDFDEITAEDLRAQGSLKWTKYGGDTIGAFVAEMDFGVAAPITKALHAAVDAARFGYLPFGLRAELAETCARWQARRYGWDVDPAQVHPVSDVLMAFELVMERFSRPGSPIILPTPAYVPFRVLPPLHGREIIEVPMPLDGERYVMDIDEIDRAYRAGGHLLILCNPHNPLGRVLTPEELAAVTEVVDRHGGRVFADEVHAPLAYPGQRHIPYASTSASAAAHTLTATSASKGWNLPGLKCAQLIVTSPGDAATWQRVGELASFGASNPGVVANAAAYRSGLRWLDDVLGYLDRNRHALQALLSTHLPQVRYHLPEATYLAWLDCRALGLHDKPGEFFLRQAGVAVVDGAQCGEAGRGHVRLNFAMPRPILERAITRVAHAVAAR